MKKGISLVALVITIIVLVLGGLYYGIKTITRQNCY